MTEDASPLLPELARSLRSLGRSMDAATESAHAAIFAPLLDARARATRGDAADALAALRGAALAARVESLARAAASEGQTDPARARARVAAVRELLEPVRDALARLDSLAAAAGRGGPSSADWSLWLDELRHVFATADVACGELAIVLAERVDDAPPSAGWLRRPGGSK